MKCPFCKAGIPVDGNKSIVRCPSCQCDVEVRKAKRMRLPDEDELDFFEQIEEDIKNLGIGEQPQ